MTDDGKSFVVPNLTSPVAEIAKEAGPDPGVTLCLSGGGFRAMLFHLGALRRLNDGGFLPSLDRVSSVSGGSITAGMLGLSWSRLKFVQGVASPILTPCKVEQTFRFACEDRIRESRKIQFSRGRQPEGSLYQERQLGPVAANPTVAPPTSKMGSRHQQPALHPSGHRASLFVVLP